MRPRGARSRLALRAVPTLVFLVCVATLALVLLGRWPKVSDLWPLDLARPGGWLMHRQIRDLQYDRELCRRVLVLPHITAEPVADRRDEGGCGWTNAVRIATVGGARIATSAATCGVAAGLALWMVHVVQPAAMANFGQKVEAVVHLGTYACRNIRGDPGSDTERSEHASANAIDISGFVLADGSRVQIKGDWGSDTPKGRFLADVHQGACRYFRVVLGPTYNSAHHDHFHLDRGLVRYCG
jgi:hypothetical protein